MTRRILPTLFATLIAVLAIAPAAIADTPPAAAAVKAPTFHALRAAKAPAIDGDLSDDAWKDAEEITNFIQHDPDDGKPATQKTVVKVVYDNDAIYIGAMMYDTKKVTTL